MVGDVRKGYRCGVVELVLGILLGAVIAASLLAGSRLIAAPRRVLSEEGRAMQDALHAATATLPHLRRGLSERTAAKAAPHLRALVQARAVLLADRERILAFDGTGSDRHRPGQALAELLDEGRDDRVHVDESALGAAVVAPLVVRGERLGSLAAFYPSVSRLRPEETRVVAEAASLVAAQVELATLEEQEERLARAELRALRTQISPHFIYNALAAVASYIHTRPDEARELLTDFAEFTRYLFRRERAYVTLADELSYVERYLRLERARFGERLEVTLEVPPDILPAVIPLLSVQPLVENAIRHGVEAGRGGRIEIVGAEVAGDAQLRVRDDGAGMSREQAHAALSGASGGIGLANVHRRLVASFGEGYGLDIESAPGQGTTVTMTVPKFKSGIRADRTDSPVRAA